MSEAAARRIVTARAGGRCELCGVSPATDWAHRRSRAQGGPWRPSNGLRLCRPCHAWTEHNPTLGAAGGWRLVHDDRDPATVPAWLSPAFAWHGWWLLDDAGMYVPAEVQPLRPVLPSWAEVSAA